MNNRKALLTALGLFAAFILSCGLPTDRAPGAGETTVSAAPTLTPQATFTSVAVEATLTSTPSPLATVLITLEPGETRASEEKATAPAAPTAVTEPSATWTLPAAKDTPAAVSTMEPLQGGIWDMEGGFETWQSPFGESCPGGALAIGWKSFVVEGEFGSSCLNENQFPPNNHSGERSQEITLDFIAAEAGIYRAIETLPGHDYSITAWGKHVSSPSPVELSLGADLSGGEDHASPDVLWFPWEQPSSDMWNPVQVTVTATGNRMTIFLKGKHPQPVAGGATMFDDVRVIHLGLSP